MKLLRNWKWMVAFVGLLSAPAALAEGCFPGEMTHFFRLSVQNVTAQNVLSPFFVVVSRPGTRLFHLGQPASAGIAELAETGSTATLESELAADARIFETAKASGVVQAGDTAQVRISLCASQLSRDASVQFFAMIGRSNDSFVASQQVNIRNLRGSVPLPAFNYDAGSEENTGNVEDFGPGGHPVEMAEGHVSYDRGLNLRGNAPETFAWGDRAAIAWIEEVF